MWKKLFRPVRKIKALVSCIFFLLINMLCYAQQPLIMDELLGKLTHPQESRREWMIWMMERAGKKNSNNT